MSYFPEILRWTTLLLFLDLCILSYFSGMLLARVVHAIQRRSWERASVGLRLAYRFLRAFREYVTAAPVEDDLVLPAPHGA